jgi:ATP-dependent exoDNAse (exonuclease V) beta subunit
MLRKNNTDEEITAKFEYLTSRPDNVILMTIHKSKGLEFDRVIFIDYVINAKNKALE